MKCLYCKHKTRVVNTVLTKHNFIKRQRVCPKCNRSYNTTERTDESWQDAMNNIIEGLRGEASE